MSRTRPSISTFRSICPCHARLTLSRALTLSLEDSDTEQQFQVDLQRALQESQSQSQSTPQHIPQTTMVDASAKQSGFLSERAQLERERLARQKRLRGDTDDRNPSRGPTPSTSTVDSEDYDSDDSDLNKPAAKRQHLATPRQGRTLQQSKSKRLANAISGPSRPSAGSSASTNQPQMFWRGEIRQTANMHVDPKKDTKPTFRLSEIIGEVRPTVLSFCPSPQTPGPQLTNRSEMM
jgi:tyrosyl-DNA phosphodiesterase-1